MDDEYLSLDGEPTQTTTSDRKRKWKRKVARLRRESFTCGNPYVADYIRERRIKFDRPEVGCMRLNEHATIIGLLSKHDIGRPTAKALRACRVGSKCGLMFSILCRSDREKQEYALVKRVFGDVNAKHLAFETIIISAISGVNTDQIVQNVRIDIEAFRRKVRNFVQRQGQAWCAEMRKVGWFELEPYTISQIREALGGNSVKGRRKARLLVEQLGVDLSADGVVWILHYHAITNIRKKKAYGRKLRKRSMFPGKWRVVVKRLKKTYDVETNLRRLVGYMLKVSPYFGRLLRPKDKRSFLDTFTLHRFVLLYEQLGFRTMKGHFNVARHSAKVKVIQQDS